MNNNKSVSEDYLHCLIREVSECMYRKEDEKGKSYRQCGMCSIANNAMNLDMNITYGRVGFPDWGTINKLILYEDDENIEEMKILFKELNKTNDTMKKIEIDFEIKRNKVRNLFLETNQK